MLIKYQIREEATKYKIFIVVPTFVKCKNASCNKQKDEVKLGNPIAQIALVMGTGKTCERVKNA